LEIYRFLNFRSSKAGKFKYIKLQINFSFGTHLFPICVILKASTETYGYQSRDLKSVFDACFRRNPGTETASFHEATNQVEAADSPGTGRFRREPTGRFGWNWPFGGELKGGLGDMD